MTETMNVKAECLAYAGGLIAVIGVWLALLPAYYSLAMLPLTFGALLSLQSESRKVTVTVLLIALAGCAVLIGRAFL